MADLLLKNADVMLPGGADGSGSARLTDGIIAEINSNAPEAGEVIDLAGLTLWPGFIDMHTHGAVGVDTMAANADDLADMARFLARQGVTAWLPTLVPGSDEEYRRSIRAIDDLMLLQERLPVARALGVHYEGPFVSEKMCGALRPQHFKIYAGGEVGLPRLKSPLATHMITLAPEVEGGIALIRELNRQGWVVSIGHTRADAETLESALAAGARHMTHFFNAMSGIHHRNLGVAGWGLLKEEIGFDIIADGFHIHPNMIKMACHRKGSDKVSLISDSVMPTGLGDGDFEVWGENISVARGRTQNERGSIAGSVITMLDAVKNMAALGFANHEAANMAALNPARTLGIAATYGSVETGKRADLLVMDSDLKPRLVMVGGVVVFNELY